MSSPTQSHDRPTPAPLLAAGGEEIDLRKLVRALFRYRKLILLLVVLGTLAGIGGSLLSTKYRSQGLFLTPAGLRLPEYKQYEGALRNERRLERFLAASVDDEVTIALLRRTLRQPNAWDRAVRPVFSITGKDARDFDIRSEDPSAIVGLQLTLEADQRSDEKPVLVLAEYLRSTIIELDIRSSALGRCVEYKTRDQELTRDQLKDDFFLEQQRMRAETLRKLIAEVPGASDYDNHQVVSLKNGGERFLSPVAQLVAVEVGISELELARIARERSRIAAALYRDFYCKARGLTDPDPGNTAFFAQVAALRKDVMKSADLKLPIVRQVATDLELQEAEWAGKYMDLTRFVVSPAGNEQRIRKPGLTLAALLGATLGLFGGAILVLLLSWWRENRADVFADEVAKD